MSRLLHETLSLTSICPSENVEDDEHIEAVNNNKLLEQGNNEADFDIESSESSLSSICYKWYWVLMDQYFIL